MKMKGGTIQGILTSLPSTSLLPCGPPGPHDCLAYWLLSLPLIHHKATCQLWLLHWWHMDVDQTFMELHQLASHRTVQCASSGDINKQKRNYNCMQVTNIKRKHYQRWMEQPPSRIYALVKWKNSVSPVEFTQIHVWFSCIHILENNIDDPSISNIQSSSWEERKREIWDCHVCELLSWEASSQWEIPLKFALMIHTIRWQMKRGDPGVLFEIDLQRLDKTWEEREHRGGRKTKPSMAAGRGEHEQSEPPLSSATSSGLCSFSNANKILPKVCFLTPNKNSKKQGQV